MIARALALLAGGAGIASAALAGAPAISTEGMSLTELTRRTAPVARCNGRDEYGCRVRNYCVWIRGYKRGRRDVVPSHCRFRRNWWRD